KDGEFYFQGKEVSFQSRGINAVFIQGRNEFSLEADAEENVFFPGSSRPRLEGKISVFIESRGQKIHVRKLKIDSKDFRVESEGSLVNPLDPELNLKTSFRASAPLVIEFLRLPFEWKGDTEGEGILARTGEGISFEADFTSNNLFLNGVDMGEMRGRIHSDRSSRTVEFNYRRGSMPREYVKVHFAGKEVEGTVKGAFLDPVTKYFYLPLPIATPAWGSFYLNTEKLEADIEFKDDYSRDKPGQYPFLGPLKLNWDLKKKVTISSPNLSSTFGEFDLEGTFNVGQDLDITIQGEVKDLKLAREFTSILLSKNYAFPETRGKGEVDLHIFGDYYVPQVQARFSFSPGGFGLFEVESVDGEAEIIEGDFFGRFNLDDPDMKGRIGLLSSQEGVKADIRLEQGLVERILPALNIDLSLEGKAQGDFEFSQRGEDIQVRGDFAAELLNFVGQDLREVSGKLEWRKNVLSLSDLQFHLHQGVVKGSTTLGLLNQEFDIHIQGEGIDLSSLYSGVTGKLRFLLDGKGIFGKDFALGPFEIKDLYHSPFQKTEARGLARFSHSQGKLGLDLVGNFSPGDNDFNVSFLIPTLEDDLSVGIRGSFTNLDLLFPWKGARGRVNYLGEVKGPKASPQVKGAIDFSGSLFPLPGFAHAFMDYSGLIFVENNKLTFRSLRAELGGGEVQGSGELLIGDGGVEIIHAKLEGKNMLLSPMERTRVLADGTLSLVKEPDRFVLEGDIYAHKLSWRREINEEVIFYSRPYYEAEKEPGFFDDLTLNIRLRADDDAWLENSIGRIRGRFDLSVTGSVSEPVVTGEMEGLGGDVYFQDRKFKLLVGRVNYINPTSTQPYLSFKGETHVKDYRVTFSLDGLLDHLNPEFTSSPPLPPEDVLALLALGEA
ncbi:MAG: translocation/assembly module TamB, partial [Candidatus Aminicenantes bacterium]|nr:translocation/assembly module TamB [Candidatus Aminicenantes bacterium]